MKKLSKEQERRKQHIIEELRRAESRVTDSIAKYNNALSEQRAKVEASLEAYKTVANAANELAEEIVNEASDYYNDRSEKWQESDAGEQYQSWYEEWEGFVQDNDIDLNLPDDIDTPNMPHADELEALPDEP